MSSTTFKELLDAGVHFGHLKRKWDPNMAPYIFAEKKGIHIIDLNKTLVKLDEAALAMKQMARSGKKILFVATKKQAKDLVANKVKVTGMPYVTERWSGGMLTNFGTIRKSIRKMGAIDKMETDGTFDNMNKRERLQVLRQREKLDRNFGTISELTRLPAAVFVVDILKEHIAVAEAKKLNIPTFAMVDTNSDPTKVDFPIPANDDATKSIETILNVLIDAVSEGLNDRKMDKEQKEADKKAAEERTQAKADEAAAKVEEAAKAKAEEKENAPKADDTKAGESKPTSDKDGTGKPASTKTTASKVDIAAEAAKTEVPKKAEAAKTEAKADVSEGSK